MLLRFPSSIKKLKSKAFISYLIVVVFKVRILTLQLDHLQPGDPLLFFGRHEVTVRIPALWLSISRSDLAVSIANDPTRSNSSLHAPTFGIAAVFD